MISIITRNILRFVFLVLFQVFIVKNFELGNYINAFVYILFILLLPFETPGWLILILSFMLGIIIDMFYDTVGINAASTVLVGYLRPKVLKFLSPRDGYETNTAPTLAYYKLGWYLSYTIILVTIHHFVLFYLEVFRFSDFFLTLLKVVLSSGTTILLILIIQYLFYKKE